MDIAVMGYGTIGGGVCDIVSENGRIIEERLGFPLKVKKVLVRKPGAKALVQGDYTTDYMDIVNDPDIKIVVETIGGVEPAYTYVKAMLLAGKHVTTSNKALVADKGHELMAIAKEKNVNFMFEASVGGGIPIIRPLYENLSGEVIELIEGIVNGTTNYIITRMRDEGISFSEALKEAQEKGFAESDPTNDVDGFDATRKIAILVSIATGKMVDFNQIPTEGIRGITQEDFKYAGYAKRQIKLIARAKRQGDTYSIRVAPFMVRDEHPISSVNGVFNGIFVRGNMLGDSMYYGSGAGKLPTASAVVGDIIDMAKNSDRNLGVMWSQESLTIYDPAAEKNSFFIRSTGDYTEIQKHLNIIEAVDAGLVGECGYITDEISEGDFAKIKDSIPGLCSYYRLD